MKKIFLISMIALFGVVFSAETQEVGQTHQMVNAEYNTLSAQNLIAQSRGVVLRGTHTLCCPQGSQITLRSNGSFSLWSQGVRVDGTYNIRDGFVNLYENGRRQLSLRFGPNVNQVDWIDLQVPGSNQVVRMTRNNCR